MKRKLKLLLWTVAAIAALGLLVCSGSPVADAIAVTGATPKAAKKAQKKAAVKRHYVFGVNSRLEGPGGMDVRSLLKSMAARDDVPFRAESPVGIRLFIPSGESGFLSRYAVQLRERLGQAGFRVDVTEYDETMLRSKVACGQFDVFLLRTDSLDAAYLKQADCVEITAADMR